MIILDEIQQCPRALTALKYFCEQMPKLALCAAGSLLGVNLSIESFPVGKVTFLDMYPMRFEEFLEAIGKQRLVSLLRTYDFSGPLPETAHDQLWRNVTHQLARSQDGSAPKFRFKDVIPGIRGYERLASPLDWLEKARLILRTSIVNRAQTPLAGFTKENWFKQYFFDVGLLCAVSGIDPSQILQYDFNSYKGYVAENFVAQELCSSGIKVLYCWEGRTSEVEFLIETASGIIPIEVKSGHVTQSKSLRIFEERYAPVKSILLSAKNMKRHGSRLYLPLYVSGQLIKLLMLRVGYTDSRRRS